MLPIIGMSPWNSYFKDKEVAYLLREALRRYGKAVAMVADVPAVNTYLAMWYTPTKAARKARLQWNALKNRTKRVIEEMGIDSSEIIIIDWVNEVETSKGYTDALTAIKDLYDQNKDFKKAVYSTSQEVLQWNNWEVTKGNVELATEYLLAELAFIYISPILLSVEEVSYVYHKPRPVYEQWIAWKYDNTPKKNLNFTLLEHPTETVYTMRREVFKDRWEVIK